MNPAIMIGLLLLGGGVGFAIGAYWVLRAQRRHADEMVRRYLRPQATVRDWPYRPVVDVSREKR